MKPESFGKVFIEARLLAGGRPATLSARDRRRWVGGWCELSAELTGSGSRRAASIPGFAPGPILCSQRPLLSFRHGQAGAAHQGLVSTSPRCGHSDEAAKSQIRQVPPGLQMVVVCGVTEPEW